MNTNRILMVLALAATAAGLAGCAQFPNQRRGGAGSAPAAVQEDAEMASLKAEVRTLQARVEGMETVQQKILTEMDAIRADRGKQDAGMRMAALEQAIKAVDASREEDKKEILNFMQKLAAPPPRKPAGGSSGSSGSSGSPAPVAVAGSGEHVVQSGETLTKIAVAYKTTVEAIVKANNLPDTHVMLRVGQKLIIPGAEGGKSPAPGGREAR